MYSTVHTYIHRIFILFYFIIMGGLYAVAETEWRALQDQGKDGPHNVVV
jgi:hypothetical protein